MRNEPWPAENESDKPNSSPRAFVRGKAPGERPAEGSRIGREADISDLLRVERAFLVERGVGRAGAHAAHGDRRRAALGHIAIEGLELVRGDGEGAGVARNRE